MIECCEPSWEGEEPPSTAWLLGRDSVGTCELGSGDSADANVVPDKLEAASVASDSVLTFLSLCSEKEARDAGIENSLSSKTEGPKSSSGS